MPLAAFALGLTNLIALRMAECVGYKCHCTIFILVYSIGIIFLSYTQNYVLGILIIAVMAGSYGMCQIVTLQASWQYYPNRKGMVTAVLLSSHGFLGVFFNFILIELLNPNNEAATIIVQEGNQEQKYFGEDVFSRFPHAMRVLGFGCLFFGLIGAMMVSTADQDDLQNETQNQSKKKEIELREKSKNSQTDTQKNRKIKYTIQKDDLSFELNDQFDSDSPPKMSKSDAKVQDSKSSYSDACKDKRMQTLFLIVFCAFQYSSFMDAQFKLYGLYEINDDLFLATVGSCSAISNGASKLVAAAIIDKVEVKTIMICVLTVQFCINVTMPLVSTKKAIYLLYCILTQTCSGFQQSIYISLPAKMYKEKDKGVNYSALVIFVLILATMFSGVTTSLLLDKIGYDTLFLLFSCFTMTALCLACNFETGELAGEEN